MMYPDLNYTTPLHNFTTNNLTFTASKTCYLFGTLSYTNTAKVTICGHDYICARASSNPQGISVPYVEPLKLKAGDTVTVSLAMNNLFVLDLASN